jgi:hypothetical protein
MQTYMTWNIRHPLFLCNWLPYIISYVNDKQIRLNAGK